MSSKQKSDVRQSGVRQNEVVQPNPDQLQALATDVGYELKMAAIIGPMGSPPDLPELGAALLESAMLHIRNLDSFLGASEAAEDDVITRHYLDSWPGSGLLR